LIIVSQGRGLLDLSPHRWDGRHVRVDRAFRRHNWEVSGCQGKGAHAFVPRPRKIQAIEGQDGGHRHVIVVVRRRFSSSIRPDSGARATRPSTFVHLPVDSITDPHPSAVDEDAPRFDEFSCGRPPEFELDEETQLKVPVPSPNPKEFELPEHVNVLFLQAVEGVHLPADTVHGLKLLLHDHRDTFASSSADLGFCPLVEHDIDTEDSRHIKQSPRQPPIAAREAEDEILDEMLATGVIEPSTNSVCLASCIAT